MVVAFQIVLLIVIVVSFFGAIGDKRESMRINMAAACIAAMLVMAATLIWV